MSILLIITESISLPTEHKMKPHLLSSQIAGLTDIRQRLNNSYNAIKVKGFFFQHRLPAFLMNWRSWEKGQLNIMA